MTTRTLEARRESFPIRGAFRIARGEKREAVVVVAEIRDESGRVGRGECVPYARYGESVEAVVETLTTLAPRIAAGLDREALQSELPPGAARNAVDCALWDLEAKERRKPVWELVHLPPPSPVVTAYTISVDTPDAVEAAARREAPTRPVLKVKLAGDGADLARLEAVRRGAPRARLLVDANEGFTLASYRALAPALATLGVALVEQPLPQHADADLARIPHTIPICADESMHDRATLAALTGRYDAVNVKLDKTGGLTEALEVVAEARAAGLGIMIGCMVCTSLSIAPALLLASRADFVDLDGPLLLDRDREGGVGFEGGLLVPPAASLWGAP
jgi:L-alanine-DL-glutamate epimerase-like enolase superfamily enzyme